MGNKCNCFASQSTDEAEDALLGNEPEHNAEPVRQHTSVRRRQLRRVTRNVSQTPRGPPPPYQQVNPFYMLTEEQRIQILARIALIQSLPVGQYECKKEEKFPSPEKEKDVDMLEKADKTESRECSICMIDFQQGDPIRLLPCMHYYHTRCIDEWLVRSIKCPICMQRVDIAFQSSTTATHRSHRQTGSQSGARMTTPIHNTSPEELPTGSPISPLPFPTPISVVSSQHDSSASRPTTTLSDV